MQGCFHHFLFLSLNLSPGYKEKSCPGKKDHQATPATLGEPAFVHFFLSYISLKMWRIVYEKQKFASVTRPLGQLGQGEHLRERWRLKGQRGQQSTFITYKRPLKLTQLWGW